jgi:hypothetical protein
MKMKASNLRKGLRVKVKQCSFFSEFRGKYGVVVSDAPDEWGQVFVKIDGHVGINPEQGVGFYVTSLKLTDETPKVWQRIIVMVSDSSFFTTGATGVVVACDPDDGGDYQVKFDGGEYSKVYNGVWYVGQRAKVMILEDVGDLKLKVKELEQKLQAIESVLKGGSV